MFNCEKWILKTIQSVVNQTYKNYTVIIIDDCSTDNSCQLCMDYFKNFFYEDKTKFRFFKRNTNVGALENIVFGIESIAKNEQDVIILLDSDDRFANNNVLEKLNEEYRNENIFMTYGSYKNLSDGTRGLCAPLPCDTSVYRKSSIWCTSHLRTMKRFVWDRIKKEDLKNVFGKFYSMSWDQAIMFPALEMCGNTRVRYIEDILYEYNNCNDLNDHKKNLTLQLETAHEIRMKPTYAKI